MGEKIGRNEPCPCGSGKKYKKCCGQNESIDFSLPEDMLTGTPLDDYLFLHQGVALYAETIARFEKEGKELRKAESEYKKKFKPGKDEGIPLSLFMSWLHFDFRFGETLETVCERFIKSPYYTKLKEPGPTHLKHLSDSYCTFYEILDIQKDRISFDELGTGQKWQVFRVNEPFEREAIMGDIWYLRFIGSHAGAYIYTPPFIYPQETKVFFTKAAKQQKSIILNECSGKKIAEKDLFRESCKATVPFWMDFFLGNLDEIPPVNLETKIDSPEKLILCNTDRELMSFSKIFFRVKERKGLRHKLSLLKEFDYDEKHKEWIWFKEEKRKAKIFNRTILGNLYLKGDRLVGETNSIERAARLVTKLTQESGDVLSYEKMESVSPDSLPKPTTEEMKKFEEKQKELYMNPEIRKKIKEDIEDYYLKEWIRKKIPVLNNQTPIEAVKTEDGKRKVKRLLDNFDSLQENMPPYKPKINFDRLRKKLGLLPKAN